MTSYSLEEFPEGPFHKDLSFDDKVLIGTNLVSAIPSLVQAVVGYYTPGSITGTQSFEQVMYAAFVRPMVARLPLRILQANDYMPLRAFLNSSSLKAVSTEKHNYNKQLAGSDINVRWLHEVPNRTKDDPIIYYFHGGGYFSKIIVSQVQWLSALLAKLENKRVSVAILDYATAPHFVFPHQLNEAIQGYNQLRLTSDKITVLGDASGGHLLATFLLQLKSLKQPPPFAAFFMSSMLDMNPEEKGSWIEFKNIDYVEIRAYREICEVFLGKSQLKKEGNPMLASKQDWAGAIPENSAATWGGKEALRDVNREFFQKAIVADKFEEKEGIHDIMFFSIESVGSKFAISIFNKWFQ